MSIIPMFFVDIISKSWKKNSFIKLIINDTSILQILVFRAILGFIFKTGYLYKNKKKKT